MSPGTKFMSSRNSGSFASSANRLSASMSSAVSRRASGKRCAEPIYSRQYIGSAQRFPEARRLTADDIEALNLFAELANDPELRLDMNFVPGDIQFLHNHTILHARTAYEDWLDVERKRHLLRLWLAPPGARPLPQVFAECYGDLTIGDRGAIICEGSRLHVPLVRG